MSSDDDSWPAKNELVESDGDTEIQIRYVRGPRAHTNLEVQVPRHPEAAGWQEYEGVYPAEEGERILGILEIR